MAYVNIPRDRKDPNYRYKMPKLLSKIEGRGNGIRTNVYNMGEIARALKRPPMYPTKFFGCELGAMVKFEENEEKALINGSHTEQDLVAILDKFIQMYVLCSGCELPEIDIIVKKGMLSCKCNACGYSGPLDNAHKAATYMVRNPPNGCDSTLGKKKKTKEERRAERNALKENEVKGDKGKDRDKKKKKRRDDEDDDSAGSGPHLTATNEDEDSWGEDQLSDSPPVSEKKKEKEKEGKVKEKGLELLEKESLTFDSPEIAEVCQRMQNIVREKPTITPDEFFTELRVLQVSQDFDAACRTYVVLSAFFKDELTPALLESRLSFLVKCCDGSVKAHDILRALERFCGEASERTDANTYPFLLQKLYSGEVLEADDILKYYREWAPRDKPAVEVSRKHKSREKEAEDPEGQAFFTQFKEKAEPFLKWLAEAESSEEEDPEGN